jgi:hypothetical protein
MAGGDRWRTHLPDFGSLFDLRGLAALGELVVADRI